MFPVSVLPLKKHSLAQVFVLTGCSKPTIVFEANPGLESMPEKPSGEKMPVFSKSYRILGTAEQLSRRAW